MDWDDPLPVDLHAQWEKLRTSLSSLESIRYLRMFLDIPYATRSELHTVCGASKDAIVAVTKFKLYNIHGQSNYGFVMGKTKLAHLHSSTIPRLELCAAVLRIEIGRFVTDPLNIPTEACYFVNKDSRVVLGYIYNESRRFHVTGLTEERHLTKPVEHNCYRLQSSWSDNQILGSWQNCQQYVVKRTIYNLVSRSRLLQSHQSR